MVARAERALEQVLDAVAQLTLSGKHGFRVGASTSLVQIEVPAINATEALKAADAACYAASHDLREPQRAIE